jgi:hypothetical protein
MTLIDLLAAIAVGGLVLLGAVLLLNGVEDTARRARDDAERMTADASPSAELRELFNDVFASFDSTQRFEGDERSMSFSTRCAAAEGWSTPCRATVAIDDSRTTASLRVRSGDARWRTLQRYVGDAHLRYFDAARGEWRASWFSSASVPDAIGVVVSGDTLIYAVGPSRD